MTWCDPSGTRSNHVGEAEDVEGCRHVQPWTMFCPITSLRPVACVRLPALLGEGLIHPLQCVGIWKNVTVTVTSCSTSLQIQEPRFVEVWSCCFRRPLIECFIEFNEHASNSSGVMILRFAVNCQGILTCGTTGVGVEWVMSWDWDWRWAMVC